MCVWPICIYLSVNLSVNSSVIQAMNHSSATIPFGQSGRIKSTWDLDCSNPKKDRNIYIYMCVCDYYFGRIVLFYLWACYNRSHHILSVLLGSHGICLFDFPSYGHKKGIRGMPFVVGRWTPGGMGSLWDGIFRWILQAGPKGDVNVGDGPMKTSMNTIVYYSYISRLYVYVYI